MLPGVSVPAQVVTCAVHLDLTGADTASDAHRRIRAALDDLRDDYTVQLRVDRHSPLDLAADVACCYPRIQLVADDAHLLARWHDAILREATA